MAMIVAIGIILVMVVLRLRKNRKQLHESMSFGTFIHGHSGHQQVTGNEPKELINDMNNFLGGPIGKGGNDDNDDGGE